jgi:hypothetical protein
MEGLTRLVAESLARHGFDRPVDYRRLHWSRWFHCESPHSLLCVPSKPGVFALAEEVIAPGVPSPTTTNREGHDFSRAEGPREGHDFSRAISAAPGDAASAAGVSLGVLQGKRMLAVVQFGEDEDMAFVLDRMFALQNPMRARLASGRCFVRFVVIEDAAHRRSIAGALNQWMISSGEKASGIGAHFASSLELTPAADHRDTTARVAAGDPSTPLRARPELAEGAGLTDSAALPAQADPLETEVDCGPAPENASASQLDSGAATNIHCPQPLPSGF